MSDWATLVDALISALEDAVPGLRGAIVHRYAPWDPGELAAEGSERHLAVFPAPEGEDAQPLTTGSHELAQAYIVLFWEGAGDESSRSYLDEEAAGDWLDLQNAVRTTLYTWQVVGLGPAFRVFYTGTRWPDGSSRVRWCAMRVDARIAVDFV